VWDGIRITHEHDGSGALAKRYVSGYADIRGSYVMEVARMVIVDHGKWFNVFLRVLSLAFLCAAGYGAGCLHVIGSPSPYACTVLVALCAPLGLAFTLYAWGSGQGPMLIYDDVRGVGIVVPAERAASDARSVVCDQGDKALLRPYRGNANFVAVHVVADGQEVSLGVFRKNAPVIGKLSSLVAQDGHDS
jgi:hypothetical protein